MYFFLFILSSDSFQRAKEKLKKAEMVTDVNTDNDEVLAKKWRRVTAAKHLTSSDSKEKDAFAEFLPSFPRQPKMQKQNCENNLSGYSNKENTRTKNYIYIAV